MNLRSPQSKCEKTEKLKSGSSTMITVVVSSIIAVVIILLYYVYFRGALVISTDPNVAACQESAALAGAIRTPLADTNIFTFNCPVSVKSISQTSLKQMSIPSQDQLTKLGYAKGQEDKYKLDASMWNNVVECAQKVNYGVLPIFDREKLWESYTPNTYCVVCSIVTFNPDIKSTGIIAGNSQQLIINKNISGTGKTLPQVLADRVGVSKVLGGVDGSYRTDMNEAVVYYRMPATVFKKWTTNILGVNIYFQLLYQSLDALTGAVNPSGGDPTQTQVSDPIEAIQNAIAQRAGSNSYNSFDVDGIVILPYDKPGSLDQYCTYYGNEKYKETQN